MGLIFSAAHVLLLSFGSVMAAGKRKLCADGCQSLGGTVAQCVDLQDVASPHYILSSDGWGLAVKCINGVVGNVFVSFQKVQT